MLRERFYLVRLSLRLIAENRKSSSRTFNIRRSEKYTNPAASILTKTVSTEPDRLSTLSSGRALMYSA